VVESLAKAGVAVRPGAPLGGPGHLRVTYGTRAENKRFLDSMRALAR
jgi:histidinol-phosphate/aromatic aminotransferase/cobyric acid decarboxylase-like protein